MSGLGEGVGGIRYHDLGYLSLRYISQGDLLYSDSLARGPIEGT
jgi:hypothetical protein